jgi:hypothetical protein
MTTLIKILGYLSTGLALVGSLTQIPGVSTSTAYLIFFVIHLVQKIVDDVNTGFQGFNPPPKS